MGLLLEGDLSSLNDTEPLTKGIVDGVQNAFQLLWTADVDSIRRAV